jgi:hypothetical protein
MAREQEKPSRDQILALSSWFGEPGTGDDPSTLGPDVITALSLLSEMINQGSKLWPPGHEECFPVQGRSQYLVGCAHASVSPTTRQSRVLM